MATKAEIEAAARCLWGDGVVSRTRAIDLARNMLEAAEEVRLNAKWPVDCDHMNFRAEVRVGRLTDTEGGRVTSYTANVRVECAECKLPFRFMGLPAGSHPTEPRVSVDAIELRAPIEPAYTTEIVGILRTSGRA